MCYSTGHLADIIKIILVKKKTQYETNNGDAFRPCSCKIPQFTLIDVKTRLIYCEMISDIIKLDDENVSALQALPFSLY